MLQVFILIACSLIKKLLLFLLYLNLQDLTHNSPLKIKKLYFPNTVML